jgi:hypothetical protein
MKERCGKRRTAVTSTQPRGVLPGFAGDLVREQAAQVQVLLDYTTQGFASIGSAYAEEQEVRDRSVAIHYAYQRILGLIWSAINKRQRVSLASFAI